LIAPAQRVLNDREKDLIPIPNRCDGLGQGSVYAAGGSGRFVRSLGPSKHSSSSARSLNRLLGSGRTHGRVNSDAARGVEIEPQHITDPIGIHAESRSALGAARRRQGRAADAISRRRTLGVTDMDEMTTRSGHYTALVETMGARGATTLHADEREQLLAVADACCLTTPTASTGSPGRWT
jgi:hypothetical protein